MECDLYFRPGRHLSVNKHLNLYWMTTIEIFDGPVWLNNATRLYLVVTTFSCLVTRPAPKVFVTFFGKTYTNKILLNG